MRPAKLVWVLAVLALAGTAMARIVPEEVVALYLFEEGDGEMVKDSSQNGNDGKINGDVKWVDGKYGGGLQFPGQQGSYVEVPNSDSLNPTKQITVAAWAYFEDVKGGNRRIIQKSTPGADNQYRLLLEWGALKFDAGPGVIPKEITTQLPPEKEWHHIAGVYDGSRLVIYVDGEEKASMKASGEMTPTTGPLFIGTKHPGAPSGDYMMGVLDEVIILNRGISQEEVKELMEGAEKLTTSVDPRGKMAAIWAEIKSR